VPVESSTSSAPDATVPAGVGAAATGPRELAGALVERLRVVIDRSPDMVAVFGPDGSFVFVSEAHRRILGYVPEDLLGTQPLDLVHPDDVDRLMGEFRAQIRWDQPTTPVDFRYRAADGTYRHVEAVAVDLSDEPTIRGLLVTSRDVSLRRRAELVVQDQAAVLERIARAAPFADTLDRVCAMVERHVPEALAAVL